MTRAILLISLIFTFAFQPSLASDKATRKKHKHEKHAARHAKQEKIKKSDKSKSTDTQTETGDEPSGTAKKEIAKGKNKKDNTQEPEEPIPSTADQIQKTDSETGSEDDMD